MGLFELHKKDIHNAGSSVESILQQAAVSELSEKDIPNVEVQCR
jgi:hypothetical protein